VRLAEQPRQPLALCNAWQYLAYRLCERGEIDEARRLLDAAYALTVAIDAPYLQATALLALAEVDAKQGHREAARERLAAAVPLAEPLGAQPLLDHAADLETRLEQAPSARRDTYGLSPRELEVLQLVAQGLTDAEVGDRLFISPRTVGRHLQSIYNKLGVGSRTAAAAYAFEHNILDVDSV